MSSLEIREGVVCGDPSVFPVFHAGAGVSSYDLLKAALEDGNTEVTKMSDSGVVSKLKVVKRARAACAMNYYDDPDAFARMWPDISQSYFFEAVRCKSDDTMATQDQAVEYVRHVRASLEI